MLFLSYPTADIIKDGFIFDFMALRLNKRRTYPGSPYECGCMDVTHYEGRFTPCKSSIVNNRRRHVIDITDKELHEYVIAYFHGVRRYSVIQKNSKYAFIGPSERTM